MSPKDVRRWLAHRRIGVLMGGRSGERQISLKTGRAIWQSLRRQGFEALAIDAGSDLPAELRRRRIKAAYLALHGAGGEDGSVQGLLEWMRIPYTGSGVLASALAMDKGASKQLFQATGLATPAWVQVDKEAASASVGLAKRLGFPLVVKPASQGSALGVSIVKGPFEVLKAVREAFRWSSRIIFEKFIKGTEITVGVLGSDALPTIEIVPTTHSFYDYHAKYAPGGSRHILPARISRRATQRASALALAACRLLQTRAVARVDMMVGPHDAPTLLEVNTIPGMTETSLLPEAAAAAGFDFDALVLKIAEYSFAA